MARAKKQPWRCKVTDERTRKRCVDKAADDTGLCPHHRALRKPSTPSEEGKERTRRAIKTHGLYSKHWRKDKSGDYLDNIIAMRGDLYAELDDTRYQLDTINEMIAKHQAGEDQFFNREKRVEREGVIGPNGQLIASGQVKQVTVQAQMTLSEMLTKRDEYVNRIARLELQIRELNVQNLSDPREIAIAVRQALREMVEKNDVPPGT